MPRNAHIVSFEQAKSQSDRAHARQAAAQRAVEQDDEVDPRQERASRGARAEAAVRQRQRDARKRKADRMFDRTVAADAPAADASPRAAVYRGQMGSSHRRSARMQAEAAGQSGNAFSRLHLPAFVRRAWHVPVAVAACMLLVVAFLYAPTRDYYTAVRDEAKIQAELDILQERNVQLEHEVAALSTQEGIADRARSDYGWVSEGDHAVVVTGLGGEGGVASSYDDISSATDVAAPDTWYSGVLDPLFGYEG